MSLSFCCTACWTWVALRLRSLQGFSMMPAKPLFTPWEPSTWKMWVYSGSDLAMSYTCFEYSAIWSMVASGGPWVLVSTMPWSSCGASSELEVLNRYTLPSRISAPNTTATSQVSSDECSMRP